MSFLNASVRENRKTYIDQRGGIEPRPYLRIEKRSSWTELSRISNIEVSLKCPLNFDQTFACSLYFCRIDITLS